MNSDSAIFLELIEDLVFVIGRAAVAISASAICAFRTCPSHGTPIEDVDASGQPIGWWWADVGSDTSGRLLARCAPSQADRHERTLEAFILERLGVLPQTPWPLLDGYHLYEVIEACEYLGMWLGNERTFTAPADQLGKLAVGMAVLSGTREDLISAMCGWFTGHVPWDVRREGKMESMAWAWNAWPKLPGTAIGDMLKRATTEAFEPVGKMGKKRFRETDEFHAERALSVLADELDVRMDALLPLAHHLGLVLEVAGPWKLDAEQEVKLRASVDDLVPSSEVSQILGLESWVWRGLVDGGTLTAFSCFALGGMYLRSDVECLVAALFSKATTSQAASVSLRTYARRHGLSVADVLMLAMDGKIAVMQAERDQPGLRSLRVIAGNRRMLKARAVSDAKVITVTEAAIALQLNREDVSRLVGIGALEKMADGILSRSVTDFRERYANSKLYRSVLGCANAEVRDRLAVIGVSACFGLRGTNSVVEREAARRALGLEFDPDDPRIAGHDLWDQFRSTASARCPAFIVPLDLPVAGTKIRTATRKITVDVAVDKAAGTITLGFDLHPHKTSRRWTLFVRNETNVREALGFMTWKRTDDGLGWWLSLVVRNTGHVDLAVDALVGMYRFFR